MVWCKFCHITGFFILAQPNTHRNLRMPQKGELPSDNYPTLYFYSFVRQTSVSVDASKEDIHFRILDPEKEKSKKSKSKKSKSAKKSKRKMTRKMHRIEAVIDGSTVSRIVSEEYFYTLKKLHHCRSAKKSVKKMRKAGPSSNKRSKRKSCNRLVSGKKRTKKNCMRTPASCEWVSGKGRGSKSGYCRSRKR